MSSKALYRKRTYEAKGSKTILFFICPFGTKFWAVRQTIRKLQRAGYLIVAYDTDNDVFNGADPNILINIVDSVSKDIESTIKQYVEQGFNDFGFFSSSLGAFIAYNCVARIPELRWGVFNTGGDIAEAMWRIRKPRRKHQQKGVTKEEIAKAWHHLQYPKFRNLKGSSYVFFSSPSDKIAPLSDVEMCMEPVREAGAEVSLSTVWAVGHVATAIRGFKRSVQLLSQARKNVK
jgi:hypothetical protein